MQMADDLHPVGTEDHPVTTSRDAEDQILLNEEIESCYQKLQQIFKIFNQINGAAQKKFLDLQNQRWVMCEALPSLNVWLLLLTFCWPELYSAASISQPIPVYYFFSSRVRLFTFIFRVQYVAEKKQSQLRIMQIEEVGDELKCIIYSWSGLHRWFSMSKMKLVQEIPRISIVSWCCITCRSASSMHPLNYLF